MTIAIDRAREWPLPSVALTAACAAGFLAAFLRVEKGVPVPILDRSLLRRPGLRRIVGAGCLDNYGWAACVFAVTLLLQVVRGLSPVATGTAFLALSAGTAVGGPLSGPARPPRLGRPDHGAGAGPERRGDSAGSRRSRPTAPFLVALAVTGVGVGLAYSTAIFATAEAAPAGQTRSRAGRHHDGPDHDRRRSPSRPAGC